MANNCYIDILIATKTKEDADKLEALLSDILFKADKEKKGMFIGSNTRYLFDAALDRWSTEGYAGDIHKLNEIRLEGWVKWCLDYTEATDVVSYMLSNADIEFLSIRYEEMGFNLYGEYVYNDENKLLTDTYVAEEDFPDYKDGENDLFYEELEEAFQKKGIEELVHDYYPYEKVQNNPDENKEEFPF